MIKSTFTCYCLFKGPCSLDLYDRLCRGGIWPLTVKKGLKLTHLNDKKTEQEQHNAPHDFIDNYTCELVQPLASKICLPKRNKLQCSGNFYNTGFPTLMPSVA
jgi:hypothetical protein